MPRHQLTTEDRRRAAQRTNEKLRTSGTRYKLTAEDARKGAATTNARLHRTCLACACTAGHAHHVRGEQRCAACSTCPGFIAPPRRHVFTAEECRRGALAAAAKRRAERLAAALGNPGIFVLEPCPLDTRPIPAAEKIANPKPDLKALADRLITEMVAEETAEARAQGREPFAPLHEEADVKPPLAGPAGAPWPTVPPDWRPALTRLRLGPMPLMAVARSHREPLKLACEAGLVRVANDDFYQLTDKGRAAIGVAS